MEDGSASRRFSRYFPILSKSLDEVSLSEISKSISVHSQLEFDGKLKDDDFVSIGDKIHGMLVEKFSSLASPVFSRYGVKISEKDGKRYIVDGKDDEFRIRFLVLDEGVELQPQIVYEKDNEGRSLPYNSKVYIFFPETPGQNRFNYRSWTNFLYKNLESKLYNSLESSLDAIMTSRQEISRYPKKSIKILTDGKDTTYTFFEKYRTEGDAWYFTGIGFRVQTDDGLKFVTKDGELVN